MQEIKYWQSINQAHHEEFSRDDSVVVAGVDVATPGGPFGATKDLLKVFGSNRVRDTPISEAAIAGLGAGAAINGLRPIVEIMFLDFMTLALDQIVNQAAKYSYMSNGLLSVPLTIRTMCGAGRNAGPQHSQCLETWLAHVPGLKVVWPATPADAKGLLKSAVRDDNPVIVIESLSLWTMKGSVPEGEHLVRIGEAEVKRTGKDITLVTVGGMVPRALEAAESLSMEDIDVEVLDLRTVSPLDYDTVFSSVSRTHRLAIAHDAVKPFGIGAEIAAAVAETMPGALHAPIKRIASPWAPVSAAPGDESHYYPTVADIVSDLRNLMDA